jgi:hypothetical protein
MTDNKNWRESCTRFLKNKIDGLLYFVNGSVTRPTCTMPLCDAKTLVAYLKRALRELDAQDAKIMQLCGVIDAQTEKRQRLDAEIERLEGQNKQATRLGRQAVGVRMKRWEEIARSWIATPHRCTCHIGSDGERIGIEDCENCSVPVENWLDSAFAEINHLRDEIERRDLARTVVEERDMLRAQLAQHKEWLQDAQDPAQVADLVGGLRAQLARLEKAWPHDRSCGRNHCGFCGTALYRPTWPVCSYENGEAIRCAPGLCTCDRKAEFRRVRDGR